MGLWSAKPDIVRKGMEREASVGGATQETLTRVRAWP